MQIVIPDDFPPTYASLDQPDLARLAPYGTVELHTTRAADRAELFGRIATAEVLINVRAYTSLDDEAFAAAPRLKLVSIRGPAPTTSTWARPSAAASPSPTRRESALPRWPS